MATQQQRIDRRRFVRRLLGGAGLSAAGGVVWGGFIVETAAAPLVLRPPGAIPERAFLHTCIRCGLCVRACPYGTLHLARAGEGQPLGMPTFAPRAVPCYLCEDVPCTAACPTGALDLDALRAAGAASLDVTRTRIGVAVVDPTSCIAHWGVQCDACYRACPLIDRAITLDLRRNTRTGRHAMLLPAVHAGACTGCGLCERACVTEEAAIRVRPRAVALGKAGDRYVRGWDRADEQRVGRASESVTTRNERSARSPVDYLNGDDLVPGEGGTDHGR